MSPEDDDRPPVSERVVAAVGRERDVDPLHLAPLHDAVDTEAIDALFPAGDAVRQFTFTYAGFEVCVESDGTIDLSPASADSSRDDPGRRAAQATPGRLDAPD